MIPNFNDLMKKPLPSASSREQAITESVDETMEWLKTKKEYELRPITLTYVLSHWLVIDWCNKNHFDYRGLIPMGLANDATGLNIY